MSPMPMFKKSKPTEKSGHNPNMPKYGKALKKKMKERMGKKTGYPDY